MLRICSVINQASSCLLNQDKLSHCCLFRTVLADEPDTLWPVQTMTAAQIMTSRTVIVSKLFPHCFYQQHSPCHRHGFCLTPMLPLYYADNLPVTDFYVLFILFCLLEAPFTYQPRSFTLRISVFLKNKPKTLHGKTSLRFKTAACLSTQTRNR